MYKRKSFSIIFLGMMVLSLVMVIALVYAGFTGQLNITGTSTARQSNWDIHFENISTVTTTGSAKVLAQPRLNGNTSIEDYDVTVTSPSDTISFTFKVVNDGNYDAEISSLSIGTPTCTGTDETSNTNVCSKLTYTLTDENGASVQVGDTLLAKDYKIMKVTLLYQDFSNASLLPTSDVSIGGLGITINYEQSGSALVKDDGTVANYRVYHQGDKITLNNEYYWVIENSGAGQDYVVALKDEPLTVAEVNTYGSSIPVSAINQLGKGYGAISFGETGYYDESVVKTVVDEWANYNLDNKIKEVNGYKARLITFDEYSVVSSYDWIKSNNYWYWTMTRYVTSWPGAWFIHDKNIAAQNVSSQEVVRPVINVYKSALETNNNE